MNTEEKNKRSEGIIQWIDMDGEYYLKYRINCFGDVYSIKKGRKITPGLGRNGYYHINLFSKRGQKSYSTHRLVAKYFIPDYMPSLEVNHKDGNKLNNHVDNLEMVTRSQNIRHGVDTGLIPATWEGKTGSKHPRSKVVIQMDLNGEFIAEHGSIRQAAKIMELSSRTIDQVLKGKGKTAGGFKWKYKE